MKEARCGADIYSMLPFVNTDVEECKYVRN